MPREFSRRNQPIECRNCGKITHMECGNVVSIDLCPVCLEMSELENGHNDNCGDGPIANCADHGALWLTLDAKLTLQVAKVAVRVAAATVRVTKRALSAIETAEAALEKFDSKRRCANCAEAIQGVRQQHCTYCRDLVTEGDTAALARVAEGGRSDYSRERAQLVANITRLRGKVAA
jgi:hypothetical protein